MQKGRDLPAHDFPNWARGVLCQWAEVPTELVLLKLLILTSAEALIQQSNAAEITPSQQVPPAQLQLEPMPSLASTIKENTLIPLTTS